jgi:hypothetical protein
MKKTIVILTLVIFTLMAACSSDLGGIATHNEELTNPQDKAAIQDVIEKIDLIGEVNSESGTVIANAENAFSNLDETLKDKIINIEVLESAKSAYDNIIASQVMTMITNVDTRSSSNGESIELAYDAYSNLTDNQKALVTNLDLLERARLTFNQNKAALVINAIKRIGQVTLNSGPAIKYASEAYSSLNREQQELVHNLETLSKAESYYSKLKISHVVALIASIDDISLEKKLLIDRATKAFESLTPEQQAMVSNKLHLEDSVKRLSELQIENVINLVNAIGEVDAESFDAIEKAKAAYAELSPSQKTQITNRDLLEKAIIDFPNIQVDEIIRRIDSIHTVRIVDKPIIALLRSDYEKLDDDQKKKVTNYSDLVSIEEQMLTLEIQEINQLIASLNLANLQQIDLDKVNKIRSIYLDLPDEAKKSIVEFEKYTQAEDLFAAYFEAKNAAAYGNYKRAYELMVNLNVMDSKKLTRDYEKIVFRWWVEGKMTKPQYTRKEFFQIDFTVYGGKPNETINILFVCSLPGAANYTDILRDVAAGYSAWYKCWHPRPEYASQGIGRMTFKNYATGEILGEFEFTVTYD